MNQTNMLEIKNFAHYFCGHIKSAVKYTSTLLGAYLKIELAYT